MNEKEYKEFQDFLSKKAKTPPADAGQSTRFIEGWKRAFLSMKSYTSANLRHTAHWVISSDGYYPYCSDCKKEPPGHEMSEYCPHCGAFMTEE